MRRDTEIRGFWLTLIMNRWTLLSQNDGIYINYLCDWYEELDSITKALQKDSMTFGCVPALLYAVISQNPSIKSKCSHALYSSALSLLLAVSISPHAKIVGSTVLICAFAPSKLPPYSIYIYIAPKDSYLYVDQRKKTESRGESRRCRRTTHLSLRSWSYDSLTTVGWERGTLACSRFP